MAFLLSPVCNESQIDDNGDPLSGGTISTYLAGTSTPAPTYTDISGATPQSNPIVLNTLGLSAAPIWLDSGLNYKFIVKDSVGVVQRTLDDISGISSSIPVQDQWVIYSAVPTFIDATHFSVAGDQTNIFQPGRRVRTTNTGGVIYGTVVTSVFGAVTTVTVVNDSGVLDAGLSQVAYGLLSNNNPSVPATYARNSFYFFTGVETAQTTGSVVGGVGTFALTTPSPEKYPTFSLVAGYRFRVSFNVMGGATNTLNVNGSGAKNLMSLNVTGTPGAYSPAIVTSQRYDIEYDGATYIVLNPVSGDSQVGEYFWWSLSTNLPNYGLLCNGAAVPRTTYARLFAKIGTFFGPGDGSTTFNVPNVPVGYTLANVPGSEGTTTVGANLTHTHPYARLTIPGGGGGVGTGGSIPHLIEGAGVTSASGGAANLAAAMYARCCIRF